MLYATDDWPALPPLSALVNRVHHCDALELLALLPDASVDAIITDLPYGTTACSWDTIIPFAPMWAVVKRVLKPRGVFVTTASEPFASLLRVSNLDWFKYDWIWNKVMVSNIGNAKLMPLRSHENILVFSRPGSNYYPQSTGLAKGRFGKPSATQSKVVGSFGINYQDGVGYPKTILTFPRPNNLTDGGLHPTQKPVALYEYLINTYTLPGELVVDPTCGSGTTGLAAKITGRRYILNDSELEYVEIARDRLRQPWDKRRQRESDLSGLPMFDALPPAASE